MARTTRSAKLARSCPSPVAASECDWFGEVFGSKDLGPIVLKHMLRLEDIAQYGRASTSWSDESVASGGVSEKTSRLSAPAEGRLT